MDDGDDERSAQPTGEKTAEREGVAAAIRAVEADEERRAHGRGGTIDLGVEDRDGAERGVPVDATMRRPSNVRPRFFLSLGVLVSACLMLLADVAFKPHVAIWVDFGIALAALALAAVLLSDAVHRRELGPARELRAGTTGVRLWPMLAWTMVLLSAWQVSAVHAFPPPVARWVEFGGGWALLVVASAALVVHEISTERVVHILEVTDGSGEPPARAAG